MTTTPSGCQISAQGCQISAQGCQISLRRVSGDAIRLTTARERALKNYSPFHVVYDVRQLDAMDGPMFRPTAWKKMLGAGEKHARGW